VNLIKVNNNKLYILQVQHPSIGRRLLFLTCTAGCCISTALIGITIIIAEKGNVEANITTTPETATTFTSAIATTIASSNASGGSLAAYLSIVFIAVYVVFFSIGFGEFFEEFFEEFLRISSNFYNFFCFQVQ